MGTVTHRWIHEGEANRRPGVNTEEGLRSNAESKFNPSQRSTTQLQKRNMIGTALKSGIIAAFKHNTYCFDGKSDFKLKVGALARS